MASSLLLLVRGAGAAATTDRKRNRGGEFFRKNFVDELESILSPPTETRTTFRRCGASRINICPFSFCERETPVPPWPSNWLSVCLSVSATKFWNAKRKKEGRNTECENVFLGLGRFMPRCHDARIVLYLQINRASQRKTTLVRDLRPPFFPTKLTWHKPRR